MQLYLIYVNYVILLFGSLALVVIPSLDLLANFLSQLLGGLGGDLGALLLGDIVTLLRP